MSAAATKLHKAVSRVDDATVRRMFPPSQRAMWPSGYLPASGVAHFLRPEGVPFGDVLECYEDMRQDRQHTLQRDFAADYTLWNRAALLDYIRLLSDQQRRKFTKITARNRLPRDADLRQLFNLQPYAPPAPSSSTTNAPLEEAAASTGSGKVPPPMNTVASMQHYTFTPYAQTQDLAMLPVRDARDPHQCVHFNTFPQIRNTIHTDYDSMTALRGLGLYSGDELVYSAELVQLLALYLERRYHELCANEETFLRPAVASGDIGIDQLTFSRETPVLALFGNGRLAYTLNQVLEGRPPRVASTQLPVQTSRRESQFRQLRRAMDAGGALHETGCVSSHFAFRFPSESSSVGDALRAYKPAIVLVEPHIDRDWISDIRGYYSVREVIALGPIDSPAMGSFSFPFLSFGVTPGPTSYWVYNNNLHRVAASDSVQMPMDPPHTSQGYVRRYLDDISAYLISPNDGAALGSQYRCLSFLRKVCPVLGSHAKASLLGKASSPAPSAG